MIYHTRRLMHSSTLTRSYFYWQQLMIDRDQQLTKVQRKKREKDFRMFSPTQNIDIILPLPKAQESLQKTEWERVWEPECRRQQGGSVFWTQQGSFTHKCTVAVIICTSLVQARPKQQGEERGPGSPTPRQGAGNCQLLGEGKLPFSRNVQPWSAAHSAAEEHISKNIQAARSGLDRKKETQSWVEEKRVDLEGVGGRSGNEQNALYKILKELIEVCKNETSYNQLSG